MKKHILIEVNVSYETYGNAMYCLEECRHLRNHINHTEYVYKDCLIFGHLLRYIMLPSAKRVPLRHMECVMCEKRYDRGA
jgi:hypothetical protein